MNVRSCLIRFAVAAIMTFGLTSCGKSGVQAAGDTPNLSPQKVLSVDDRSFLLTAQRAELMQTALSQIALNQSTNDQVRSYAKQVIANYGKALTDLGALMKAKNISETFAAPEAIELGAKNRLEGLSGGDFDDEFVSLMTAEQQGAVAAFDSAAETSADPDIRNYAQAVLPLMREDFKTVTALQKKLAADKLD